jgi:DNA repair protein RecO (recombination protein O)
MERLEPTRLVALLAHGEHGAVARFLSAEQGLIATYIRGARGRRLRPVLQIGNRIALDLTIRSEKQLPVAIPYLLTANMAMMQGATAISVVELVAALASGLLPEAVPQPAIFAMADALFEGASANVGAAVLAETLVRFELALLTELGLGLDLASCAATGTTQDLCYVSPRSRQAVSQAAGAAWSHRLLPLPSFLLGTGAANAESLTDGLKLSGYFLAKDAVAGQAGRQGLLAARARVEARLIEQLKTM